MDRYFSTPCDEFWNENSIFHVILFNDPIKSRYVQITLLIFDWEYQSSLYKKIERFYKHTL